MKKQYRLSIFIFTRDLRIIDNTTLLYASSISETILPIFIFNPDQLDKSNKYKSNNCVQFMMECLDNLNESLNKINSKLFFFYGKHEIVIKDLLKNMEIDAVFMNKDYSPYAINREEKIKKVCEKNNIYFDSLDDYLLTHNIKNGEGDTYTKFTPFYNKAKKQKIKEPITTKIKNFIEKKIKIKNEYKNNYHNFYKVNNDIAVNGGRDNALNILKNLKNFKNYNKERDYFNTETTHLSAYLKFNVVSIREVYYEIKNILGSKNKLLVQLYWRDFYMLIMQSYPHVIGGAMKEKYNKLKWNNDRDLFELWKNGETGYPIIDAGMRQLNKTGWMHNRARMIVSSFLVKVLHIDWRFGELYFAQKLVDYDVSNNSGGWQWSASTGADSQPYFRYFSPFAQSEKYDPECKYIKKWIPELKNVNNKDIHKWDETFSKHKIKYSKPIVKDIGKEIEKTIKWYSDV